MLSDINYDMQSGVVQQFNVGFSRMRWPNLSYYIGSRYLRRVQIGREKGSNVLVMAISYVLDPRYTLVLSQQYERLDGQVSARKGSIKGKKRSRAHTNSKHATQKSAAPSGWATEPT